MAENGNQNVLSVLIVDEDPGRSAILEQALKDGGCRVIAKLSSGDQLVTQVALHQPDVIIIDLDTPDRDTLEQMHTISRDQPRPIVMFAEDDDSGTINQAIKAGVSAYIVDGLAANRVKPVMEVAIARFREYQALRDELAQAKDSLEERKLIDRAKALLIKRQGMSEEQAHQALRKLAMDQGKKLVEVARSVIAVIDLLQP
ncbi:MAG: ANTAR domain-containing protein [Chromatiales bacterium]|nr:ANTAR domain-containing protein [Chromatiales bacterium]